MNPKIFLAMTVLALVPPAPGKQSSPDEEQASRIVEKFGGWFAASSPAKIAQMTVEERAVMMRYYRERLDRSRKEGREFPAYRNDLLYLGDPQVVGETVKIVLTSDPESPQCSDADFVLVNAARPETIAMLAPAIMVDEPFIVKPMLGDVGSTPPRSYGIAHELLQIMARSPAFPEEVRKWAEENGMVPLNKLMPMMRRWWKENEHSLKTSDYESVRPGEDLRKAELAAENLIRERMQAYRQHLIATGRNPADRAQWEEWRNEIYPKLAAIRDSPPKAAIPSATPVAPPTLSNPPQAQESNSQRRKHPSPWVLGVVILFVLAIAVLLSKRRS